MSASVSVTPVVVPQVNVNDDSVMLVRWQVESGATVTAGDAICDVETTKAASEMMAPATGVLVHRVEAGTRVAVGQAIAAIGPDQAAVVASFAAERIEAPAAGALTITPRDCDCLALASASVRRQSMSMLVRISCDVARLRLVAIAMSNAESAPSSTR